MIRTAIPELKKAIEEGCQAIASFPNREGLLECEEYLYSVEEEKLRLELRLELIKAKQLIPKQKGFGLTVFKMTKGNPVKILFCLMALWKNFKFKKLWQRIYN